VLRRTLDVTNFVTTRFISRALAMYTRPQMERPSFQRLAEAVPQLIWVTDASGAVVYVNRKYEEYTGYALAELCGLTAWRKALHPDDLERCISDWISATTTGSGYETEYRLRRASDASWRWHLTRALPIHDDAGQLVNWFGTCTDIDEHKQVQAMLRVTEERLLRESQRKDEFLAMLGHELRNPLMPILSAVQLMKERDYSPELDIIERQALHMTRLVDDLLDVARITRGRVELRKELVELASVVDRAIETTSPLVQTRRHRLFVDVPRKGLVVDADPVRLAQAIGNLINNAAKYTEPGGTIYVRATRDAAGVALAVTDSGIGMSADDLSGAFELFAQAGRALDRSQGGLGIGLTLVRSLIELHGGRVEAASAGPGHGSTFVLRMPIALATVIDRPPPPPSRDVPAHGRVLVIDDNRDIVAVLESYLTWKGYQVAVAYDGESGLEVARAVAPDVVLLDIGLPIIDGYEVARRLRADPELAHAHLIALTGYGQASDREHAQLAGFDDHLVKPVSLPQLLGVLQAHLAAPLVVNEAHADDPRRPAGRR
jgi:PAS domain S-box-containing protein